MAPSWGRLGFEDGSTTHGFAAFKSHGLVGPESAWAVVTGDIKSTR